MNAGEEVICLDNYFTGRKAFREPDTRREYGEDRVRLYGQMQKKLFPREIQAHRQRRTDASDA